MRRPLHWFLVLFAIAVAIAGAAVSFTVGQEQKLDDPLPLRRILIPASRLPAELERIKPAVLMQTPRDEFESLVQRAAAAAESLKKPPRLVRASYTAELEGQSMAGGGQWSVLNPGAAAGVLPLEPLNLALSRVKTANGSDAVLGDFDGKSPGLLVDKSAEQRFFFDWSLRGTVVPNGLKFDIQITPCPAATLELKLPADHWLSVAKDAALVSGPHEAEQPSKRTWRLQFAGRSRVEIVVRRPADPEQVPPLLLCQLRTKQQVTPRRILADFEFNLEVLHTTVRELVFDCDPALQPLEVTSAGAEVKAWEHKPGNPAQLVVELRENVQGPLQGLRIRSMMPRPADDKSWTSPWVRLRNGLARGETLQLHVHPDVQIERLTPNGFGQVSSATDLDGGQRVTLVEIGTKSNPGQRPTAYFRSEGFDLSCEQRSTLQIKPRAAELSVETRFAATRGNVFQLALRLPDGGKWLVENVDMTPSAALRTWSVSGPHLLVDLQKSLGPRNPISLKVQLTQKTVAGGSDRVIDVPQLDPVDAALKQGVYAVSIDRAFQSTLIGQPIRPAITANDEGAISYAHIFSWREKFPIAKLRLTLQRPLVAVQSHQEVVLSSTASTWQARLDIDPVAGEPERLDFILSAPVDGPLLWSGAESAQIIQSVERLPDYIPHLMLLAVRHPADVAQALSMPRVERWRLRFSRPLAERTAVTLRAKLITPRQAMRERADWAIPVLTVQAAARGDGAIKLLCPDLKIADVESQGMKATDQASLPANEDSRQERSFSFPIGHASLAPTLSVATAPRAAQSHSQSFCDYAHVTTLVEAGVPLLHRFQFRVWNWREPELPMRFSRSAGILAVKINGRWLNQLPPAEPSDDLTVRLPVVLAEPAQTCEVLYTTQAIGWTFGKSLDAAAPVLPTTPQSTRHEWVLAPGLTPLDTEHWQSTAGGEFLDLRGIWRLGDPLLNRLAALQGMDESSHLTEREAGAEAQDSRADSHRMAQDGWTTWLTTVANSTPGVMTVVSTTALHFAAVSIAVLLLGVAWLGGGWFAAAWRVRIGVCAFTAVVALIALAPGSLKVCLLWPLGATLFQLVQSFIALRRQPRASASDPTAASHATKSIAGAAAVVVMIAVGLTLAGVQSGGPEPHTVYLVEAAGKGEQVFAAPEVLRKLEEMERRGPASAVLVSAVFQGRVKDQQAEFTAQIELFSLADKAKLILPLSSVELKEGAFLDGAPVFPVAVPALKGGGYQLPVAGKGFHHLTLTFTARVVQVSEYQEIRFGIPKLYESRLELSAPVQELQIAGAAGRLTNTSQEGKSVEVKAEVGRGGQIVARWRSGGAQPQTPQVDVRENYFWDLRPSSLALSAMMQFAINKGSLDRLHFSLPPELEVRGIELVNPADSPSSAVVKEWRLIPKDGKRLLVVELAAPATGRLTMNLGLVPRLDLAATVLTLRLPVSLDGNPTGGMLAYRLEKADAGDKSQNLALTTLASDQFTKAWLEANLHDTGPVTRAYSFRRSKPDATLTLTVVPHKARAIQEVEWRVGPDYADLTANIQLQSSGEDITFVELALPASVTLAGVQCPQLHHWSRHESLVQVWLSQPRKQVSLQVNGWARVALPPKNGKQAKFELPALAVRNTRLGPSTVTVAAADDVTVETERTQGLSQSTVIDGVLVFTADVPNPTATFLIQANPPAPDLRALTVADLEGDACAVTIHVQARRSKPHLPIILRVKGYSAKDVSLVGLAKANHVRSKEGDDHVLTISLPADGLESHAFRLHGALSADKQGKWTLPQLAVENAKVRENLVAIRHEDLRAAPGSAWLPVPDHEKARERWHAETGLSDYALMQARSGKESLRVEKSPHLATPGVNVIHAEQTAFMGEHGRWLHQSRLVIVTRAKTGTYLELPAHAELLALAIDGVATRQSSASNRRRWTAPPGNGGIHVVELRWAYVPGAESATQPNIGAPLLEGVSAFSIETGVIIPPGFRVASSKDGGAKRDPDRWLAQGRSLLKASKLLSEAGNLKNQDANRSALRMIQKHLAWLSQRAGALDATRQFEWKTLQDANAKQAKENGWLEILTQAARNPAPAWPDEFTFAIPNAESAADRAVPVGASAQSVEFEDINSERAAAARRFCEFIALALVAFLVLSFLPRGLTLLVSLWPEELVLIAGLGTWAWGISILGTALALLGISGRLCWCVARLRRLAARTAVEQAAASS